MSHLEILIINLVIITLLPMVAKAPVASAMKKIGGGNISGYDNKLPRLQQQQLTGTGARCLAAHHNSYEALTMFAPAVLLLISLDLANMHTVTMVSIFTLCRILYLIFYWMDTDKLRSSVWGIGFFINIYLLIYPLI